MKEQNNRYAQADNDVIVDSAMGIVDTLYIREDKTMITSPHTAREVLYLRMHREHEVFVAMFLDSKHRVLAIKELFRGIIDSASVPSEKW